MRLLRVSSLAGVAEPQVQSARFELTRINSQPGASAVQVEERVVDREHIRFADQMGLLI